MVLEETAKSLIEACQRGETEAFHALFEKHKDMVYSVALRYTGDAAAAQDVAQDVFLKLHASLGQFREQSELVPWLYRITVNRCLDIRKQGRNRVVLPETEIAAKHPDPEESTQTEQTKTILRASLNELPDRERTAIVLRDLEGRSTAEVARILRSSESTVRSQISMGRKKLKDFILRRGGIR
jgi:RNA polymerase sigma-70 factor, ECF subfamily